MAAPRVTVREVDLTTRVPSFPGLYIGIVIPDAKKGPVNRPVLCTSEAQFLDLTTVNGRVGVGFDGGYFSALAVFQKSNKLWFVRPLTTGMLYGGAKLQAHTAAFGTPNVALSTGEDDPLSYSFGSESMIVTGADQGAYNNDLRLRIYSYKARETFTVADATTDVLTVGQAWGSGFPIRFSTTGVLPAPLNSSTTYFAIAVSNTSIKVATTQANALAGTAIDLTTVGSGVNSILPAITYAKDPDTFLVQVYHKNNLGSPIEEKICSKTPGQMDGYGRNIYVEDVFISSKFIRIYDNPLVSATMIRDQIAPLSLAGGSDGSPATDGDCILALGYLSSEDRPLTLIIDGGRSTVNYHQAIIAACEARNDCVGILSTPFSAEDDSDYLNKIVEYNNITLNANSSHAAIYSTHVQIYDKFNDRDIFVSPDGFVAALISQSAANFEIWFPVAGFRRGIMNVKDVRRRFSKGEMDYLYDNNINPIRFAPGRGILIWGQKTLLRSPSALDRLNVRLLLTVIEPSIAIALEDFLFELNDDATRSVVKARIDAAMDRIQARRGVQSFETVCDRTNNDDDDINNNRMNVYLFIVANPSIEDIPFTLVLTPSGMELKLAQSLV